MPLKSSPTATAARQPQPVKRSLKINDTDRAIIRILQMDGRRPYAEIAAELGLAPSTVQQRANRLIEAGVIKIYGVTDPEVLGSTVTATVALKVDGTRMREIAAEIARIAEVGYVVICTGAHDILLEVACQDNDHLLSLISDKLAKVKGVRDIQTFVYLRIVKNTYQWGLAE
jgi:Lrp/AsnC family transcriptional regulator for asnA, asnC and gidA